MSVGPRDDPTSLGNILLEWEIITEDQLDKALKEQEELRGDDLLGKLLIANGFVSEEEIQIAMSAQASMRESKKTKRAMAVADIAIERSRRKSMIMRRCDLLEKAERINKSITRDDYPAVQSPMLAKPSDS